MRIAVYTITKNEEKFIQRWAESAADADIRLVVDTGSSDDTWAVAKKHADVVHQITVSPWRFDIARNTALSLLPADIDMCIALDADEVLLPGWREALEAIPGVNRPSYEYTWSWNADGSPGLTYAGDKIHARHGYFWRHPVHEVLTTHDPELHEWCNLKIHHFPDDAKSRASYLPLLELAVTEDPSDDRNAHYLAREYLYRGDLARAAVEFKRHLSLPKARWAAERARSMMYLAQCIPEEKEAWLLRAVAEDPHSREQWVTLAQHFHDTQQWEQCYAAASRALAITQRPLVYINEQWAWGSLPHDLAAISAHWTSRPNDALRHGAEALDLEPSSERLKANLSFYRSRIP